MKAYIGLGSNLGDGLAILADAWRVLGEDEGITAGELSSPYMTAPVDMASQHWFTNAVGWLETTLPPLELLKVLLAVEVRFGRERRDGSFGYQDRSLDLDLLYYGDIIMDTPELILPHPRIADRLFVLAPFAELAADFHDPLSGRTMAEMAKGLRAELAGRSGQGQEIIKGSWNT